MYLMVECRAAVYGACVAVQIIASPIAEKTEEHTSESQMYIGCVEEGEVTEVIIGTGILRPQILDPGLGRPEVNFRDPGWSSELYITKVEVFK
jgi:hypothetical protein